MNVTLSNKLVDYMRRHDKRNIVIDQYTTQNDDIPISEVSPRFVDDQEAAELNASGIRKLPLKVGTIFVNVPDSWLGKTLNLTFSPILGISAKGVRAPL